MTETYQWTDLGVDEITNLYLYGATTTPDDLLSDSILIAGATNIYVDQISYMETGPGRFALGSESWLVQAFFSADYDLSWMEAGVEYTKDDFIAGLRSHGVDVPEFYGISVTQSLVDDGSDDYLDRAYVWNKGTFALSADVLFVVDTEGGKTIKDYSIVPFGDENFNFESQPGSWYGDMANSYFLPAIDPWNIGDTVTVKFVIVGDVPPGEDYTYADYLSDSLLKDYYHALGLLQFSAGPSLALQIVQDLWTDGVTQLIYQGKPIVYGGSGGDVLSRDGLANLEIWSPLYLYDLVRSLVNESVVLVGGPGNDTLTGSDDDDILVGGADKDQGVRVLETDQILSALPP